MEEVIIEVYNNRGVRQEYRKFQLPVIRIGRGFDNDVVIADPFVSAHHLIIREGESGWDVEDLGSENGMFVGGDVSSVQRGGVVSGDEIVIGKTHLRFYRLPCEVPAARKLAEPHRFYKELSRPAVALGLVLVMCVTYGGDAYLSMTQKVQPGQLALTGVSIAVISMIWAALWAFVGRLIKHRPQFTTQLSLVALFFIAMLPFENITNHIGYITSSSLVDGLALMLLSGIGLIFFLTLTLSVATNMSLRNRLVTSGVITGIIVTMVSLSVLAFKEEFNPDPEYYAVLKPYFAKIAPKKSIEQFLAEGAEVFEKKEED
jgi:hypothetical protein